MRTQTIFLLLLCAAFSCACTDDVKTDDRGVTVKVGTACEGAPSLVRLEVLGDKLIHVSATPERKFADPGSLVILPLSADVPFELAQKGDTVVLATSSVRANILKSTGEVWFTDAEGRMILQEQRGGGKRFVPIEVEGTEGYSFSQVFESPEDEAFYGLGQHQADEFNYKGKNEELFQYNTKVSVPFVVSNKGYGVLMDSYSMMRFGNPADYKQLGDVFRLYDARGKEGCLTGTYVPENGQTIVRDEPKLYFEYLIEPEMEKVEPSRGFRVLQLECNLRGLS